jgi:hypothetical protein
VLRTLRGKTLAVGDLIQFTRDDQVTIQFTLRFKDGSLHDETTVYSQCEAFRLISDHLIQKGPSFPHPMEVLIDATKGKVIVITPMMARKRSWLNRLICPRMLQMVSS